MNTLQEAERILSEMSRAEKAQVLQWVVEDLGDAFPAWRAEFTSRSPEPIL